MAELLLGKTKVKYKDCILWLHLNCVMDKSALDIEIYRGFYKRTIRYHVSEINDIDWESMKRRMVFEFDKTIAEAEAFEQFREDFFNAVFEFAPHYEDHPAAFDSHESVA